MSRRLSVSSKRRRVKIHVFQNYKWYKETSQVYSIAKTSILFNLYNVCTLLSLITPTSATCDNCCHRTTTNRLDLNALAASEAMA